MIFTVLDDSIKRVLRPT